MRSQIFCDDLMGDECTFIPKIALNICIYVAREKNRHSLVRFTLDKTTNPLNLDPKQGALGQTENMFYTYVYNEILNNMNIKRLLLWLLLLYGIKQ